MTGGSNGVGAKRSSVWRRVTPVVVCCAGVLISLFVFRMIRQQERERFAQAFAGAVSDRVAAIQDHVDEGLLTLRALASFFRVSEKVRSGEFREFVEPFLSWQKHIQALEWVPRVAGADRLGFEEDARRDLACGYEIVEIDAAGQRVRAPDRGEYFPVYFVEPLTNNERVLGFNNPSSDAARWESLARARDTGEPVATGRITLVQETGKQYGLLIFAPVYRAGAKIGTVEDRRRNIKGFVVAVFRIGDLIEASLAYLKEVGVHIEIYDSASSGDRQWLHTHWSRDQGGAGPRKDGNPTQAAGDVQMEAELPVAGRTWKAVFTPTGKMLARATTWHSWASLLGGLVTTGILAVYMLRITRQTLEAERLAGRLLASNRALDEENAGRKRVEEALRESRARLELAQHSAKIGSFEWNIQTNQNIWSDELKALYGLPAGNLKGRYETWTNCLHPDDRQMAEADVKRSLESGEYCSDFRVVWGDGSVHWLQARAKVFRDADGKPLRMVGVNMDITQRKALEDELRKAAWVDKLTGLPNRALLNDRLQQAIGRHARRRDCHYAVLFLDMDRFKIINDSLGHEVGDQLLMEIARRLRWELRAADSISVDATGSTAARLGGDEFVVLLDGLRSAGDAQEVGERLLESLAKPYQLGKHEVYSTASIGVVTSEHGYERAEDVIRDADTAMYEAKLGGKGRVVVFDRSMRERVQTRLMLEMDLRKALGMGQFVLYYQPIVSLETGEVESYESLVRWQHPKKGLVQPGDFITIAEESGLIVPLGDWVFREACRQLRAWWDAKGEGNPRSVSINLSRNQLMQPNLIERLKGIVAEVGVDVSAIHLEITESAVMRNMEVASGILRDAKRAGFKIDMDDFGTGYSSLACLHQLPFDVLKIDRSFVANLDRGKDFAALVNAISMLARNLGISVIAEGVETPEQVVTLQALECQFAQGYFFGRPAVAGEAIGYRPMRGLARGIAATDAA